jgi:hypothetical protein
MKTYELRIGSRSELSRLEDVAEECCRKAGLEATMKDTLRSYPGSIHWHFRKSGELRGSLEFTLWKEKRMAWFSVHDGGEAAWIDGLIVPLRRSIESGIAAP